MTVRGTTPTHVFAIPWTEDELDVVVISYVQNGELRLMKTKEDLEFDDAHRQALLHLSEQDTLALTCNHKGKEGLVVIQIRAALYTGEIFASKPMSERVLPLFLDEQIMSYGTLHTRTLSNLTNKNSTTFTPDFGQELNNTDHTAQIINNPVTEDVDEYVFDGGRFDSHPDAGNDDDNVVIYDGGGV